MPSVVLTPIPKSVVMAASRSRVVRMALGFCALGLLLGASPLSARGAALALEAARARPSIGSGDPLVVDAHPPGGAAQVAGRPRFSPHQLLSSTSSQVDGHPM